MQLLDSEQLEYAFAAHGISLERPARKFYADIWTLIQTAEKAKEGPELSGFERGLRRLCQNYFALIRRWRADEEDRFEGETCCPLARANIEDAAQMLPVLERQFFRYALCYLELNRALIVARRQLAVFTRDLAPQDLSAGMAVNHATGSLLTRAHRERKAIMEKRLRLDRARSVLKATDPLMERLGEMLPRLLPGEGDRQLTLLKGALRRSDFAAARDIAKSWPEEMLRKNAYKVIDEVQQNAADLKVQDSLLLHSGELGLIGGFLEADEMRINRFLGKYNVPYMLFQYKALIHQGYLLGRIGSLEGLIVQHAKLSALCARPHDDETRARMQEQAVLVPARQLVSEKFRGLSAIFDNMETITATLERLFSQTRDYTPQTPAEMKN